MKILFTGDWQCRVSNLEQCDITLQQILRIIQKEKVSCVVNLGDLKDAFNPVDQRVTNFLIHSTREIVANASYVIIPGNHDYISPTNERESCLPVVKAAGGNVFEQPSVFFPERDYSVAIVCVPYMRNTDLNRAVFSDAKKLIPAAAKFPILAFHADISGCKLSVHANSTSKLSLQDLCADAYKLCLGGHIHYQQKIGPNSYYVGPPFCQDWGEVNQRKGFVIVDTKSGSLEFIKSDIPTWYDPDLPGEKPKDFLGVQVRIRVPIDKDPALEMAAAKAESQKKFPGAALHLVPVFGASVTDLDLRSGSGDADLIREYLEKNPPAACHPDAIASYLKKRIDSDTNTGVSSLEFLSVEAENVLSFKKKVRLEFRPGLTLVTGENRDWVGHSNGSGKTSLLSLPYLAMYGETPKKQTHSGWVHKESTDLGRVRLEARLSGKSLIVVRERNPNRFDVRLDGRLISLGSIQATRDQLSTITGVTRQVFENSLYIGQRDIATVLTGTDKERKELFARFLALGRFKKAEEVIKKDLVAVDRWMQEITYEIESLRSISEQQAYHARQLRSQIVVIDEKKQEALIEELSKLEGLVSETDVELAKQDTWLDENQKKFEEYLDRSGEIRGKLQAVRDWLQKADAGPGIKKCPLCGASVSIATMEKHLEELREKEESLNASFLKLEKLQNENRKRRRLELETYQKAKRAREAVHCRILSIKSDLAKAESDRARNKSQEDLIRSQEKEYGKSLAKVAAFKSCYQQLSSDKLFYNVCLQIVSRDGLPAFLCSLTCPKLNSAASRYSEIFDGEIQVKFEMSDGDLDVQIQNLHGGPALEDQSEGELRIAGMVTVFAFRELLVQCNMLVLDEPGEGLDPKNAAVFAKSLKDLSSRFGCVFVTTHNAHILANLEPDHHIQVTKENGQSTLKEV